MKVFGFLIILYGWFILDYHGFNLDGAISVLIGVLLLCGPSILSYLQWRPFKNDK